MAELFPGSHSNKGHGVRAEQSFHNNEWRKYWFSLPAELSRTQADLMYPADDRMIAKYTR